MASCTAAEILLLYFLAIAFHLQQLFLFDSNVKIAVAQRHVNLCRLFQILQFSIIDVVHIVLGKSEQEHAALGRLKRDQSAKSAGTALPLARHSLLDDPAAKVGIDESAFRPRNGVA